MNPGRPVLSLVFIRSRSDIPVISSEYYDECRISTCSDNVGHFADCAKSDSVPFAWKETQNVYINVS